MYICLQPKFFSMAQIKFTTPEGKELEFAFDITKPLKVCGIKDNTKWSLEVEEENTTSFKIQKRVLTIDFIGARPTSRK